MITQELAKQLAVKIGKRKVFWTAFAVDYAEHNQTVIADKEALQKAFGGGE